MKILSSYAEIKKNTVITIGNFDGVHKGHQKIIKETVKLSKKNNLKSVVITFKPHPNIFFKKFSKPFQLTNDLTKIGSSILNTVLALFSELVLVPSFLRRLFSFKAFFLFFPENNLFDFFG